MQCVAIVYKRSRPEAAKLARIIKDWLTSRHVEVLCQENVDQQGRSCASSPKLEIPPQAQTVIVLGGDGTLLSVARFLAGRTTPVMGINLGGLGFLTEINMEDCFRELKEILGNNYEIEERMRLEVTIQRDGQEVIRQSVLNDAVINKGALARIIDIKTSIDGKYLTNYRADGLIVATPTGSTAYNLSAGGPIVYPTARVVVLTPICPFTLTHRPIILPSEVVIQVEIVGPARDLTLTCDGQVGCELSPLDRIRISTQASPLRLIKTPSINYFEILRTKLKWGQAELRPLP
ncbi:MAG TPA: NAD(+)/NADH kinase [Syntrophobacteraceae bacterium]|nr:NAD(+)/NADH kinase [Syntrophobacteraceae bacterium]